MTTLQYWSSTVCSGHFQAAPESSQTPPKRSLSLLVKIQPWGNSKSARLRAVLGLAGPYSVSSPGNDSATSDVVEANTVGQKYGVTKGAWLAAADAFSDGQALQALQAPEASVSTLPLPLSAPISGTSPPRRKARRSGNASGNDGSVSGADSPRSSASRSPSRGPSRSGSDNLADRFAEGLEQAEEIQRKGTPGVGGIAEKGAPEGTGVVGPEQVDLASAPNPLTLTGVPGVHWQETEGAGGSDAEGSSLGDADRSRVGVHDGGRNPHIPSNLSADRHVGARPPSAPVSPRYMQGPTGVTVPVAVAGPTSAAAVLARLRSGRPPPVPAPREPLHPTWLVAPRRAGLTGHNAKGWIPLSSGVLLPFRRPSTSPRVSSAQPDSDDLHSLSGLISVTPAPLMPAPSTSPGRDSHCAGPTSPRPTSAAPALRRSGGSSSSRPNSRSSDQVLSSFAGMTSTPALAGGDSLAALPQPPPSLPMAPVHGVAAAAAVATAPPGATQSPVLSSAGGDVDVSERDEPPGAASRAGTLQGPLRGSRMQGHVTAVANPAYYAAAAAAAAATAAAVAGYAPPPGLLREINRRQRLLQPDLAIAGAQPAGSAMSLTAEVSAAAGRGGSFTGAGAGAVAGVSTTSGGGSGSGNSSSSGGATSAAGALRPSLTQHKDVLAAGGTATAAVAAGPAGTQRWVSPPGSTVVANGVQGHAFALRPSSAYQAIGQAPPASLLPHAHPPPHIQSHPAGSSWGSMGGMSEGASLQAQALALATASSWSGGSAAATNAALLNQQHRLRQENLGMSQAPTQQRVLLANQALQQQAKQGRSRRPSLTEFGNARALLQHRPTEGWIPGAAADVTPSGKVGVPGGGGPREGSLAASAPCLSTVLQEAAEGRISIGGGEAIGGGGGGRQSMIQVPTQRPISPGASDALAMGMLCPPGAIQKRPSSNSRASFNVSAGAGGGSGSNGGSSIGGSGSGAQAAASVATAVAGGAAAGLPVGGATAWLSGGVSLLQALAGGTDSPPHHHHQRRRHQRHQNRNQQQQHPQQQLLQHPSAHHPHHVQAHHRQSTRHARAMSGARAAAVAVSVGSGGSSGGVGGAGISSGPAAPFLSMSPGPGRTNVQRSYGRGGRVH